MNASWRTLIRSFVTRPLGASIILLACYFALSFANDDRGYLGADTGTKVATLRAMDGQFTLDPDVGYWAADQDPDGRLHPLYGTTRRGDQWIAVTTLPMLELGAPLYRLGGYRLALLLPMLGAVFTALAARALVRRLLGFKLTGSDLQVIDDPANDRTAWAAFWLVGLASPVTIYALDFWEHTAGLALMSWGVVALFDAFDGHHQRRSIFYSGMAFGAAATMRTEALAYGAVAVAVFLSCCLWRDRRVMASIARGAIASLGIAVFQVGNYFAEHVVSGGAMRVGRATGLAADGGSALGGRIREGLLTTFAFGKFVRGDLLMGILVVTVVLWMAHSTLRRRGGVVDSILIAAIVVIYAGAITGVMGFVPGIFPAAPLAALGIVGIFQDTPKKILAIAAFGILPIIWTFQYSGAAGAQWGGRYVLFSSFILGVIGLSFLPSLPRKLAIVLVVVSITITGYGVTWLSYRSHVYGRAFDEIEGMHVPVLVSSHALLLREGGGFYGEERWLTASGPDQLLDAAEIVYDAGFTTFAIVDYVNAARPPRTLGRFEAGESRVIVLFGGGDGVGDVTGLRVTTYG